MKLTQSKLNLSVVGAGVVLALAASQASAALNPFPVAFSTQSEATITSIQALDFGPIMDLTAFGNCTLDASALDFTSAVFTTTPPAATGINPSAGSGCLRSDLSSNMGHYVLNGTAGANVKIKLHSASGADFDFAPAGLWDPDPAVGTTNGGVLVADMFSSGYKLSTANGDGGLIVGGQISIGNTALTAGQAYTMDYDIEITF